MSSKTILIVDDSLTVRQHVSMILKAAGYEHGSRPAMGARVRRSMRSGVSIAMVICDVNMPVANGLEFLETIKGEAAAPPVPVVMLHDRRNP